MNIQVGDLIEFRPELFSVIEGLYCHKHLPWPLRVVAVDDDYVTFHTGEPIQIYSAFPNCRKWHSSYFNVIVNLENV